MISSELINEYAYDKFNNSRYVLSQNNFNELGDIKNIATDLPIILSQTQRETG